MGNILNFNALIAQVFSIDSHIFQSEFTMDSLSTLNRDSVEKTHWIGKPFRCTELLQLTLERPFVSSWQKKI